MSIRLNRFEKFFSKRKGSAPESQSVTPSSPSARPSDFLDQRFPSPTFIRPKASRMAAREEVRGPQYDTRSPSVPDLLLPHRMDSVQTSNSSSGGSSYHMSSPTRSSSMLSRRRNQRVSTFDEFQFPKPPSRNGMPSPVSLTFSNASGPQTPQRRSPKLRLLNDLKIPSGLLDTPPSSDHEDDPPSPRTSKPAKPAFVLHRAPPTPEDSPELSPVEKPTLRSSKSVGTFENDGIDDHQLSSHGTLRKASAIDRSLSCSNLNKASTPSFKAFGQRLREPSLDEYLDLSDDEVAELELPGRSLLAAAPSPAPKCSLPSTPTPRRTPAPATPWSPSLLTLAPPLANRAATAAAFESARIAQRYDFDLVYVVNLWPNEKAQKSKSKTPASGSSQVPMMGRMLAAYGIDRIPSPLQISAGAHCKVLRSEGWIEYRNEEALSDDLSLGYAYPFYPGEFSRPGSANSDSPVSGVLMSERIDRGIVFAAYRRPRSGASKLGVPLNQQDLRSLHDDAEALVEMLIDIHVTSQLVKPLFHGRSDSDVSDQSAVVEVI